MDFDDLVGSLHLRRTAWASASATSNTIWTKAPLW
jgi:hypothetical protein